eukprot:4445921-Amphidinium_carterae.2
MDIFTPSVILNRAPWAANGCGTCGRVILTPRGRCGKQAGDETPPRNNITAKVILPNCRIVEHVRRKQAPEWCNDKGERQMSDGGGEFVSAEIKQKLQGRGGVQSFTPPHQPQSNGLEKTVGLMKTPCTHLERQHVHVHVAICRDLAATMQRLKLTCQGRCKGSLGSLGRP